MNTNFKTATPRAPFASAVFGANANAIWKIFIAAVIGVCFAFAINPARADDAERLDKDGHSALQALYASAPTAKVLGDRAKAILVFPSITKAGLVVGGQYGEGILIRQGKTIGYYNTASASFGLQAGAQTYGYAMFFMTDKVFEQFSSVKGFEVGVGPTVVVMDEGMTKDASTETLKEDIYAFVFGQKGLMAGVSLQGNKITKLDKK